MIKTAGNWDPAEPPIYFLAADMGSVGLAASRYGHLLIALNELTEADIPTVEDWLDKGSTVFLDSGVFNLANSHARAHGTTMDQALSMAPEELEGFEHLFDKYLKVVNRLGERLWGYIEIDQGGRENKLKTRKRLEDAGLRPIPVYHPLNDGWDYFDELATRYDRICMGNIVQADRTTRKRLLATAWERKRSYPNLWIHLLGLTPNEWTNAYPVGSADSSAWLSGVRWATSHKFRACGAGVGIMPLHMRYALGSSDTDRDADKARHFCAYEAWGLERNWRALLADLEREVGCDYRLPKVQP